MKLRNLLLFLLAVNLGISQNKGFKAESNLHSLDAKSYYVDIAARDTFGLKDLVNAKGDLRLKGWGQRVYFSRPGLKNYSSGIDLKLPFFESYGNISRENQLTENSSSQDSPIGRIKTKTTILDKSSKTDFGARVKNIYKGISFSYEQAESKKGIDIQTLIEIQGQSPELIPIKIENLATTRIFGVGIENTSFSGLIKIMQNSQDENKYGEFLISSRYKGLNFYWVKGFNCFVSIPLYDEISTEKDPLMKIIPPIVGNVSYDGRLGFSVSTEDYSKLHREKFERSLEDKLRAIPRIRDDRLKEQEDYLLDMFFTDLFSFSIGRKKPEVSINLKNLLVHSSENKRVLGLKYGFAITTYDFKRKEVRIGFLLK